ncbi:MAG: hypothetical protein WD225_13720 [Ilumatobacteraceae bacterium]
MIERSVGDELGHEIRSLGGTVLAPARRWTDQLIEGQFQRRCGRSVVEALCVPTPERPQQLVLVGPLDTLRHDDDAETATEVEQRSQQVLGPAVGPHSGHDRRIELDHVGHEIAEHEQRGSGATHVVERDTDTELADRGDPGRDLAGVLERHLGTDLDLERGGTDPRTTEVLVDDPEEVDVEQLPDRDIDRHDERPVADGGRHAASELDGVAQHTGPHRHDDPGVGRGGDELGGLAPDIVVAVPAGQRLELDHARVEQVDHGLEVGPHAAGRDGLDQLPGVPRRRCRGTVDGALLLHDARTPLQRGVETPLGRVEQHEPRAGVARGDADGRAHRDPAEGGVDRGAELNHDVGPHPVRDSGLGCDHDEALAARARDHGPVGGELDEAIGDAGEDVVAGAAAVAGVHGVQPDQAERGTHRGTERAEPLRELGPLDDAWCTQLG